MNVQPWSMTVPGTLNARTQKEALIASAIVDSQEMEEIAQVCHTDKNITSLNQGTASRY